MTTATFSFKDSYRLTGDVVKKNNKTVLVRAALPEDFGGEVRIMKCHIVKNNVVFGDE